MKSTDGKSLGISCGRSSYKVVGLPEADFPSIPEAPAEGQISFEREMLLKLVSQTSFAVTSDESRFAVSGGLLVVSDGNAAVVATDGHRLAYSMGPLPEGTPDESFKVVLPRKTMLELRKMVDGGEETISFARDDKHVFFRSGDRTMISRLLEGTFPAYDKVIPMAHPRIFVLGREEFMAAVRRVAILSSERTHAIRIGFTADRIVLKAESPELGEATEFVPHEYDGPEFQISFNAHYVIDFLGAVGTERFELRLKDAETQALFLPQVKDGQSVEDAPYRYVIMPMRT